MIPHPEFATNTVSSLCLDGAFPEPGSEAERMVFARLKERLVWQFREVFPNPHSSRCVVVVPGLSMDMDVLGRIAGVQHYEERLLCLLMLLRMPRTHLVYVTSVPISPAVIDYYLHLLPGIPSHHARRRLTLLSCYDDAVRPLSLKLLARPRLLARIREAIPNPDVAHLTCFNATPLERTLAVRLGIPLYACDPSLADAGSKSGSREIIREAGITLPDGFERLRDEVDMAEALVALKQRRPELRRAVVKLNEGASGEGNALFSYQDAPAGPDLHRWIGTRLPRHLRYEAPSETWETYQSKFREMGGVVECFIEGTEKRSPSYQGRINPLGEAGVVSTHEQVLGGPSGQIFQGCTFPADEAYRLAVQEAGWRIGEVLRHRGVISRFGVDFVSVREADGWQHYAIEINLRKGGTTHPFQMLQFLTDGAYDLGTGLYFTPGGQSRYYYATDNLIHPSYQGLTPDDLFDIAADHGLHFHSATQQGVTFHLIGALSRYGKLGLVCVGDSPARARWYYDATVRVLDHETRPHGVDVAPTMP
jgi:hypothetical protein